MTEENRKTLQKFMALHHFSRKFSRFCFPICVKVMAQSDYYDHFQCGRDKETLDMRIKRKKKQVGGIICDATVLISIKNKSKGLTAQTRFHQAFKYIVVLCNSSSSIYLYNGNHTKEVKACCTEQLCLPILKASWNAGYTAFTQHKLLLYQK